MDLITNTWFDKLLQTNQDVLKLRQNPIAYFCAEFALSDTMPIYSGGLGVLAGDMIKEANTLGIPLVGVGLLYKEGFFKQVINNSQNQEEQQVPINPRTAGMSLLLNSEGTIFTQSIPINGRTIGFQTWHLKVGSIDMYFIDTDIEQNNEEDRHITQTLYGGDSNTRILQEIFLGIGGEKVLFAQGIYPSIYHMNEGHSAFAALGIIHHTMKLYKTSFEDAFEATKKKLIFSNHTLVSAGNDVFNREVVIAYLKDYASEAHLDLETIIQKGYTDGNLFSMTMFAMNLSFKVNAVSILHAQKAKELWPNYEMIPVTNGVNTQTWLNPDMYHKLSDIAVEKGIDLGDAIDFLDLKDIWDIHQKMKEALLKEIFTLSGSIFDKEILTMTWSRRIAQYKRPDMIFLDIESLKRIMNSMQKPVQIIIAGKAHPKDDTGKAILHNILTNISTLSQPNRIIYIPNYSISLAAGLVAGSDLWLNTPVRGFEACGTSGMKAGGNGALQFSVPDGWTDEVNWTDIGWTIDPNDSSSSLYWQLENDITSTYYSKQNGFPLAWINRMKETMKICIKQYSAKRMISDYFNKMYIPSLKAQQ